MDTQPNSTGKPIDLARLREKFPADSIEWRIGRAGKKGDKVWATALPYITNRAIQARLDEVCGPENWKNEFKAGPQGGVMCGISIRVNGEWIEKWDGADNTDVESVKGGFSDAMKRSAVQWGVGRYLYDLNETWAVIDPKGEHVGVCKDESGRQVRFRWNPPKLPPSALPGGNQAQPQPAQSDAKMQVTLHVHPTPKKADQEKKDRKASAAQVSYIERLAERIGMDVEQQIYAPRKVTEETLSFEDAKAIIDQLKTVKASPASRRKPSEKEIAEAERRDMKVS